MAQPQPRSHQGIFLDAQGLSTCKGITELFRIWKIPFKQGRLEEEHFDAAATLFAPKEIPHGEEAARLGKLATRLAENRSPLVMLIPPPDEQEQHSTPRALAHLVSCGAIVCSSPTIWAHAAALISHFGIPESPQTAIVSPEGSWLSLETHHLMYNEQTRGLRHSLIFSGDGQGAADAVVVDNDIWNTLPDKRTPAVHVPCGTLPGNKNGTPVFHDIRNLLAAIKVVGTLGQRLSSGLGPDNSRSRIEIDKDRLERQRERFQPGPLGDHETKLVLASYGIPVTRQAVATTPSAAVSKAKQVGFPVELRSWEAATNELVQEIETASHVRHAFNAIARKLGTHESAVIVRETPPQGLTLSLQFEHSPYYGPQARLIAPGRPRPIYAPAPMRSVDAERLTRSLLASRTGDVLAVEGALAETFYTLSHLFVEIPEITELNIPSLRIPQDGPPTIIEATATIRRLL